MIDNSETFEIIIIRRINIKLGPISHGSFVTIGILNIPRLLNEKSFNIAPILEEQCNFVKDHLTNKCWHVET